MSAIIETSNRSLVAKFANKFSIDPDKLMPILRATAFKVAQGEQATNEQMAALLIVADQHGLNPFTREIFAFPDKKNGIVPVVSVDGWTRIINSNPQMDGVEFDYSETMANLPDLTHPAHEWIEAVIYRKDRARPVVVREYLNECYRPLGTYSDGNKMKPGPWQTHTNRFLRHKALIQCARVAFSFAGIYDEDEAQRILESAERDITPERTIEMPKSKAEAIEQSAPVTVDVDWTDNGGKEIKQPTRADVTEVLERHQKVQQQGKPIDPDFPMSQGLLNVLKAKMVASGLTEANLKARFSGHGFDSLPATLGSDACVWAGNPDED